MAIKSNIVLNTLCCKPEIVGVTRIAPGLPFDAAKLDAELHDRISAPFVMIPDQDWHGAAYLFLYPKDQSAYPITAEDILREVQAIEDAIIGYRRQCRLLGLLQPDDCPGALPEELVK